MLEWIGNIATGITIGSGVIGAQSLISGYTLAKKVDLIAKRIETLDGRVFEVDASLARLDERLYSISRQSVWISKDSGLAFPKSKLVLPTKELIRHFGINVSDAALISELGIESPKGFYREVIAKPEHFLHAVQPLNSGIPELAVLRDKTLVPWHFKKDGVDYIGFIKKGYLKNYLGIDYKPSIINDRMKFAFKNPYTGSPISRNEKCYCGSGLRYKHYCGSLT